MVTNIQYLSHTYWFIGEFIHISALVGKCKHCSFLSTESQKWNLAKQTSKWLQDPIHPKKQYHFRPGKSDGNSCIWTTLQEINISHLGKKNIIFKMDFSGDMLVPRRVHFRGIWLVQGHIQGEKNPIKLDWLNTHGNTKQCPRHSWCPPLHSLCRRVISVAKINVLTQDPEKKHTLLVQSTPKIFSLARPT